MRKIEIHLTNEDHHDLRPGSGVRFETGDDEIEVIIYSPPRRGCVCGTVTHVHEYAEHPDCEYRDHHCEYCHEMKACTDKDCDFHE